MLVTLTQVLAKANKRRYAVGAFNFNNLETLQAIMDAAEVECSPVILSTSEGAIEYAGMPELAALAHIAAKKTKVSKSALKSPHSSVPFDSTQVLGLVERIRGWN